MPGYRDKNDVVQMEDEYRAEPVGSAVKKIETHSLLHKRRPYLGSSLPVHFDLRDCPSMIFFSLPSGQ